MSDERHVREQSSRCLHGLGVVLVNYRCLDLIATRVESGALGAADVVLVDNASDPEGVVELAQRTGSRCVLNDTNLGFAGGVNSALRAGWPPYVRAVLLLNPDVEIARGDLEMLLAELDGSRTDAVAPVVVDVMGRPWVSAAGGPVTFRAAVWYFGGVSHLIPWLSGFFWTRRQVQRGGWLVPSWLCGAVLMVRRASFDRFGPLPEHELMYGEDVGWGIRCTQAGGRLALVRDVTVVHAGGASGGSAQWLRSTERLFRRELGTVRGGGAVLVMRAGLAARRIVRRLARRQLVT